MSELATVMHIDDSAGVRPWPHRTIVGRIGDALVYCTRSDADPIALVLTSSYVGRPSAPTQVSHVMEAGDEPTLTWARTASEDDVAPADEERCATDHLQEVQDALRLLGHHATIELRGSGVRRRS